jgi:hypothetical protein
MKIVNKQEFYKLPNGTLYSEYEPCIFSGLKIKNDTFYNGSKPFDFVYEELIGNVDADGSYDRDDILIRCQNDKSEFDLDFDCSSRDGTYKDDALYAVYDSREIIALSDKISGCSGFDLCDMIANANPFDNKERTRYYGLRIGDIVSPKSLSGEQNYKGQAVVVNYGSDNNRVDIKFSDGSITDWVAEWCDIVLKVEDRNL